MGPLAQLSGQDPAGFATQKKAFSHEATPPKARILHNFYYRLMSLILGTFYTCALLVQDTMDAHTADAHSLCNLVGGETFTLELVDLVSIDHLPATLVDALGFRLGNALSLTLADDIPLELSECAHHL